MAHTILVIDDEPASVRAVERTLADDHRVLTVSAAARALEVLETEPVALIVADQRMPDMTGTELLARSAERHPEVIRILLTGYTGIETLIDAINAGHVYYYLTKPWEPRELRLLVRRGLEKYDVEAERRALLRDLEQACRRSQREAEQKGRLLGTAAHELGTPLHIVANSLALLDEEPLPASARTWLDTARRSADWLGRCLAQMLNGARWGNGRFALRARPIDVCRLLAEVRGAYDRILEHRQLTLSVRAVDQLPTVVGDPLWLARALSNLLSNAVRFTPDGGRITVSAVPAGEGVEIAVTDSGIGIDATLLDELFEPFSAACGDLSLHTSGRFEFGSRGLGLGLAITKAIIDRHGGSIGVRTQTGVGTQFTIRLPARIAAVASG